MSPKQLVQLAFARAVKVQARPTSMIVHSMIVPEGSWSMPQQRCHGMLQLKWDILEELCAGPRISTAMLKVLSYVTTFAF
jgi:hypothetical protein